jgi:hypothetical protein
MEPNSNGHQKRMLITEHDENKEFPRRSGSNRPCRDAGGGEIDPSFAVSNRAKRASHIDPPASSEAIMRMAPVSAAKRTLNPARTKMESLTIDPESENRLDHFLTHIELS